MSISRSSLHSCLRFLKWQRGCSTSWTTHKVGPHELRCCGVQDLAMTLVVVVSLVEYKRGDFSKPKPLSKGNHAKSRGDKGPKSYNSSKEWLNKTSNAKEDKGKWEEFTLKTSCFLCDSSHWTWDCPKRKTLKAMIDKKEKKWCSYGVNVAPKCL